MNHKLYKNHKYKSNKESTQNTLNIKMKIKRNSRDLILNSYP